MMERDGMWMGRYSKQIIYFQIDSIFALHQRIWVIPQGWGTICDGVNCYIRKCTIYYPWLWLLINIVVISYWRWRDWFHSNLKNCECALIIKDNRWYIYGCNNWHCHKSCPNLVEWPIYEVYKVLSGYLPQATWLGIEPATSCLLVSTNTLAQWWQAACNPI